MSEVGLTKAELDTPVLWVDLDIMERNIATMAAHFDAAGIDWRPHTKGVKIPAIAHKALAAGAISVTCAKLGEAEVMAAGGVRDILIANQIVTPKKIDRLVHLRRQIDVKVAVDNPDNVALLGGCGGSQGRRTRRPGRYRCGLNRTGLRTGAPVLELATRVTKTAGLTLRGVMGWEGHVLTHQDAEVKRREVDKAMGLVRESVALCAEHGLSCEIVSGGGSGTAELTPFTGVITEIQADGGIFSDALYRTWNQLTEPCLYVRSTVTSRPAADRVTIDAGFKTLPSWFQAPITRGRSRCREPGFLGRARRDHPGRGRSRHPGRRRLRPRDRLR